MLEDGDPHLRPLVSSTKLEVANLTSVENSGKTAWKTSVITS
jgi:hypothetical protein